ncbi:molybdenum cofactor biosynthesis protein A [Terriglobus roseus DSM 18391]|uniref:GTP 3',8-cyclase n=1 Tax=Terriglobus roseus (strain DSM 18391 / NRRL B-41598 / KBS 63) TaxID=926566 RepID=I3ZK06_TERRK|nr:GTP 3',8-cyclase MoaA [Terriglobus roseus]AFL89574.1 molybdenum cofactor biosynthesis protein A [Terriglobus roseus DSM 18391]
MATTLPIPALDPAILPAIPMPRLRDRFGRAITDLRVAVTDRCNYRCVYCRTGEHGAEHSELPIPAYAKMVRLMVEMGVEKIRLTGGEPLLRAGLLDLIRDLRSLRTAYDHLDQPTSSGKPLDIAITTNGHLLAEKARSLKDAGLDRITVSMDAVDSDTFTRITRVPRAFQRVLDGIHAAQDVGLAPVKVNCVLLRGFNDDQIEGFGEFARREGVILRFIEFMPLEEDRIWSPDTVVTEAEILERLNRVLPLVPLPANALSETARRYGFADGIGEIGIIAPVSRPFCGHCSRIRLTSDGKLRTCLFSQIDHDLYGRMARGSDDDQLRDYIRAVVHTKEQRHHIGEPGFLKPSRSMVHIGG